MTTQSGPTLVLLQILTVGLEDNDWTEFAERVSDRWPALGAYEALHAEAANNSSPPVRDWPTHTMDDYTDLVAAGVALDDVEGAEALWRARYGEASI